MIVIKESITVGFWVFSGAGSNDYSDNGWMDAGVGFDYNNDDKPKPSKKAKGNKNEKGKGKRKKNESCEDPDVNVGRGVISGGYADGRSTPGRCR